MNGSDGFWSFSSVTGSLVLCFARKVLNSVSCVSVNGFPVTGSLKRAGSVNGVVEKIIEYVSVAGFLSNSNLCLIATPGN